MARLALYYLYGMNATQVNIRLNFLLVEFTCRLFSGNLPSFLLFSHDPLGLL